MHKVTYRLYIVALPSIYLAVCVVETVYGKIKGHYGLVSVFEPVIVPALLLGIKTSTNALQRTFVIIPA